MSASGSPDARRRLRRAAAASAVATLLTPLAVLLAAHPAAATGVSCVGGGGRVVCQYFLGDPVDFVVPDGVSQIQIVATGGGGSTRGGTGVGSPFPGSYGATVRTVLAVTAGQRLTTRVGQAGTLPAGGESGEQPSGGAGGNGFGGACIGGGGGGATVVTSGTDRLVVAGGGGGTGYGPSAGGDAGPATSVDQDGGSVYRGGDGSDYLTDPHVIYGGGGSGGGFAPGSRGSSPDGTFGQDGTGAGLGGAGAPTCAGGGGGGWTGGGGGSGENGSSSGGGGAGGSYSAQPFTVSRAASPQLDGSLTISYPPDQAPSVNGDPSSTLALNDAVDFHYTVTGTPTPTVSLASGDLPPGLTLGDDGHLTGAATAVGSYTFTVRADNGAGTPPTDTSTIVVRQAPSITGTPPASVNVGSSYDFTYGRGGYPLPSVGVTAGDLPPGLALASDGHLTGTPTSPGSYTFTATASNGVTPDASTTNTVVVQQPATLTGTPPNAGVGEPYAFTFSSSGYPSPTVTQSAGTLPPGLTLVAGKLSGTPTRAGTYHFTVQATNGVASPATRSVTLVVRPQPAIHISNNTISEGNSGTKPLPFRISLTRASTVPVTVDWSTVNGSARAGSDYTASHGTVTFTPGATTATVTVLVRGDRVHEPTEVFRVHLSNAHHGTIPSPNGTGAIVNDD